MKKIQFYILPAMLLAFLISAFACSPKNCPVALVINTPTPTITFTGTLTPSNTATNSPTNSPTSTPTNSPTPTPAGTLTPTATPTCTVLYSDNFSSNTLSNYDINQRQAPNLASVTITGGELVVGAPAGSSVLGGVQILVKNSVLSQSLSNYTIDLDMKMDLANGYGNFGAAFRGTETPPTDSYYSFLMNRDPENVPPNWQPVDFHGTNGVGYTFLGGAGFGVGQTSPAYTPGNWVHIKVVCIGNTFRCYADTGSGSVLVYNFSNSTYAAGGVGFHADFLENSNAVHFKNFVVSNACY